MHCAKCQCLRFVVLLMAVFVVDQANAAEISCVRWHTPIGNEEATQLKNDWVSYLMTNKMVERQRDWARYVEVVSDGMKQKTCRAVLFKGTIIQGDHLAFVDTYPFANDIADIRAALKRIIRGRADYSLFDQIFLVAGGELHSIFQKVSMTRI